MQCLLVILGIFGPGFGGIRNNLGLRLEFEVEGNPKLNPEILEITLHL